MKKIGVIGAGAMGCGIAHVASLSGFEVILVDVKDEFINKGLSSISKNMDRQLEREKISIHEKEAALSLINISTDLNLFKECDLVIEAVTENLDIKGSIFKKLDQICRKDCILSTNTSSISITEIASYTTRPQMVIGMHFMNPVPVMKLVEVIRGHLTDQKVVDAILKLAKEMGKIAVECNDYPGFVANRILMPMINESIYCLMEGVAESKAIDDIMKLGTAHPMGPLELADLIGLDVCLAIMQVLHEQLGDDKYRPCPLVRRMVAAGTIGRKSGQGFYNYKKLR